LLKAVVAATEEEASCLIANLVAETTLPCPCDAKRGLRIEGKTFDDRPISIRIDAGAGVLYIDGMTQEEVDSIDILHDIIAANEIFPKTEAEASRRLSLQREVMTNCKIFLTYLDIALEQGYIDIRRCEYWTKITLDVKNLTASWYKKDAARFSGKAGPR
jgi:hypothetical protein